MSQSNERFPSFEWEGETYHVAGLTGGRILIRDVEDGSWTPFVENENDVPEFVQGVKEAAGSRPPFEDNDPAFATASAESQSPPAGDVDAPPAGESTSN